MHYLKNMVATCFIIITISFSQTTFAEFKANQTLNSETTNFNQNVITLSELQLMPLIANFSDANLSSFTQVQTPLATSEEKNHYLTWLFAAVVSLFGVGRGISH